MDHRRSDRKTADERTLRIGQASSFFKVCGADKDNELVAVRELRHRRGG
jgi:hypothetical protein